MKQIIFATGNPTKAKRFSKGLIEHNIEVLSLRDIGIHLTSDENGANVIENAIIKAKDCYNQTGKICMGMDDSLYLEGVPEDKQPGLFVRRSNDGKALTDEEVLDYFIGLVKQYGINGRLNCKWVYGLAVIDSVGEIHTYTWEKGGMYMVDTPSSVINPGYPLNSISKYNDIDKYFTEITEEDKKKLANINEDHVVEFIAKYVY